MRRRGSSTAEVRLLLERVGALLGVGGRCALALELRGEVANAAVAIGDRLLLCGESQRPRDGGDDLAPAFQTGASGPCAIARCDGGKASTKTSTASDGQRHEDATERRCGACADG